MVTDLFFFFLGLWGSGTGVSTDEQQLHVVLLSAFWPFCCSSAAQLAAVPRTQSGPETAKWVYEQKVGLDI